MFSSYLLPLTALAIVWIALIAAGLRTLGAKQVSDVRWILSVLLLSLMGFVSLGFAMKFPFWGRHLSPLLPFLVFLAVSCCREFKNRSTGRITAALLGLLWAVSSANIRLDPRFSKDDYRNAADLAKCTVAAREQTWWAADTPGANFYGLFPVPLDEYRQAAHSNDLKSGAVEACHSIINASKKDLESLPEPKWVILSKPDIYDNSGDITRFLKDGGFKIKTSFISFDVWTR